MLEIAFLLVVLAVVALVVFVATRPSSFRVERGTCIQASPEVVYANLVDFHRWQAWSPWEGRDPNLRRSFDGAASGTGAIYAWEGNKQVGKGRMEIVECAAPSKLRIQLDFLAPFEAHNTAEFTLVADGDSTEVTWAMYGPSTVMSKIMSLFMSMDAMVGKDFEAGLAKLKAVSEA